MIQKLLKNSFAATFWAEELLHRLKGLRVDMHARVLKAQATASQNRGIAKACCGGSPGRRYGGDFFGDQRWLSGKGIVR